MAKPIPDGYHTLTPYLVFLDSRKAIEFYKKAFNAQEIFTMPGRDGKGIMHGEIKIGNSIFMLGDETDKCRSKSAESLGVSPVSFFLYVEDVDHFFKQAVDAGGKIEMDVQEMFWGDRAGTMKDPFGYIWMIATHKKDLTPEQMKKAAEEAFDKLCSHK